MKLCTTVMPYPVGVGLHVVGAQQNAPAQSLRSSVKAAPDPRTGASLEGLEGPCRPHHDAVEEGG